MNIRQTAIVIAAFLCGISVPLFLWPTPAPVIEQIQAGGGDIEDVIVGNRHEKMGAFSAYEGIGTSLGGFGRLPCDGNGSLHIAGLLGGSLFRASYEADRSTPEHQRYDGKQPLAGLDPEYRDFGSVLSATLTLLVATSLYLRGWTMIGWIIAAYSIFGLPLRMDLWSLAIGVM